MTKEIIERLILNKWVCIVKHEDPEFVGTRVKIIDIQWKDFCLIGATSSGYTIHIKRFEDVAVPKYITHKHIDILRNDVAKKKAEWAKFSGMSYVTDEERKAWLKDRFNSYLMEYEWTDFYSSKRDQFLAVEEDFDSYVEKLIGILNRKIEEQEARVRKDEKV